MAVQVVDDHFPEPAAGDSGPYALIVSLQAKPGRAEELEHLLLEMVEPTRGEAGCVFYHLNRDRHDPDTFVFYEAYSDLAAFRSHLATPYIRELLANLPPYLARDNVMTFLSLSSEVA